MQSSNTRLHQTDKLTKEHGGEQTHNDSFIAGAPVPAHAQRASTHPSERGHSEGHSTPKYKEWIQLAPKSWLFPARPTFPKLQSWDTLSAPAPVFERRPHPRLGT